MMQYKIKLEFDDRDSEDWRRTKLGFETKGDFWPPTR